MDEQPKQKFYKRLSFFLMIGIIIVLFIILLILLTFNRDQYLPSVQYYQEKSKPFPVMPQPSRPSSSPITTKVPKTSNPPRTKSPIIPQSLPSSSPITNILKPVSPTSSPATINVSGNWSGTFTATSNGKCFGYTGNWSAMLAQQNGIINGQFDAKIFSYHLVQGLVHGSLSGDNGLILSVGGEGNGVAYVTFTGEVVNNSTKGTFSSVKCPFDSSNISGIFSGEKVN